MQEQTCQNAELDMVDEQTVERVANAIVVAQDLDWMWLHPTDKEDYRASARAAIAAMPDTKALEAADNVMDAFDQLEQLGCQQSAARLSLAIATYRAARGGKP